MYTCIKLKSIVTNRNGRFLHACILLLLLLVAAFPAAAAVSSSNSTNRDVCSFLKGSLADLVEKAEEGPVPRGRLVTRNRSFAVGTTR